MAVYKLLIDDFVTIEFGLIAIHSTLEDHRLAYFMNRELGIRLEKGPNDIGVKIREGETSFSRFVFEDNDNDIVWNLIQNKNKVTSAQSSPTASLFEAGTAVTTNVYLMPELKKVDYVLKIENDPASFDLDAVVSTMLRIRQVTTAYKIDHQKLKSKNNLIF